MKSRVVVRTLAELGDAVTLAPERYRAAAMESAGGGAGTAKSLASLVEERAARVMPESLGDAIVIDTTHARDGVLDIAAAKRARDAGDAPSSAKKRVRAGDLLVSRLRPYLRQIALVHPAALALCEGREVVCSMEFYVLSPKAEGESLAYLVPWILGEHAQATLAAAQEGGHHPRVPRETLLAMRVPKAVTAKRAAASRAVNEALEALYSASDAYARALAGF